MIKRTVDKDGVKYISRNYYIREDLIEKMDEEKKTDGTPKNSIVNQQIAKRYE